MNPGSWHLSQRCQHCICASQVLLFFKSSTDFQRPRHIYCITVSGIGDALSWHQVCEHLHYFLVFWLLRHIPGEGNSTPLVLLPGKSHGRRSLVGCSPWCHKESDMTERLHFHFSLSCIGEGNGNPLQCSCLENARDRGAWWAAVYGVAQSQTQLKGLSSSSRHVPSVHWGETPKPPLRHWCL